MIDKEPTLKELQMCARSINEAVEFDPPLRETERNLEALVDNIKANAPDLEPTDRINGPAKDVLRRLGVGPWLKEEVKEPAKGPSPAAEEKEEEGAMKKNNAKTSTPLPKKKVVGKRSEMVKDEFGFLVGGRYSDAMKLFKTGKYTMSDVREKMGDTFYVPLKKCRERGFKVVVNPDTRKIQLHGKSA